MVYCATLGGGPREACMKATRFYGWSLLATVWVVSLINLGFPMSGSSVLNAAMLADLHLDRRTLGLAYSVFSLMSGLPGPAVAYSVRRFGVRFTLIIGSLMVIVGSVLLATLVTTGTFVVVAFGLFVGSGVGTGAILASQAGLARWFIRRRALAMSVLYTAGGIGGFVAAPLANRVMALDNGNWRAGWWMIAVLSCLAALVAFLFVKERPEDVGQLPDGDAAPLESAGPDARPGRRPAFVTAENWTPGEALAGSTFWLMMVAQLAISCGYVVFGGHGVVHLQDLGHLRDAIALAVGTSAAMALIPPALVAVFGDRVDPRYLWAAFAASMGFGMWLVIRADTIPLMYLSTACIGIGFSGGVLCVMTVVSNYFGPEAFPFLGGLTAAINTALSSITAPVAGWLYDEGLGYSGMFLTVAVWSFAGAILLLAIRPPVRRATAAR
jgi:MFS family permease